jgi:hypothetical protein
MASPVRRSPTLLRRLVTLVWLVTLAVAVPIGATPARAAEEYQPTLTPAEGYPGSSFVVGFPSRPKGPDFHGCSARIDQKWIDCVRVPDPGGASGPVVQLVDPGLKPGDLYVEFVVPPDARPGPLPVQWLIWNFKLSTNNEGRVPVQDGHVDFLVLGATSTATDGPAVTASGAPPPEPPEFSVQPGEETASPGLPFTVAFTSLTTGVSIRGCGLTYRQRAACSRSGVAVVMIAPGAKPDSTITLAWELAYSSTRPHEKAGARSGKLSVRVVVEQPHFAVTVQPSSAAPGAEVTLAFESLVKNIEIVDCIAFFPHDAGNTCQRSTERWLVRTRVPMDALPGATLLRWGVASRTAGGAPLADSDVLAYTVRPPTKSPTSTKPTPAASASRVRTVDVNPTPGFVAVTDPESAAPGERVRVTLSALDPGVRINGCAVAFPGRKGTPCRRSGGQWSATVTVPDRTPPGDLPLRWSVTSRSAKGVAGSGSDTIDYRVLATGTEPPPAFSVRPVPPAARIGARMAVFQRSLVDGVSITGCSAGFTPAAMADCRPTEQGWVADVLVPDAVPPGTGTVLWTVAYTRTGAGGRAAAPGSTDGLLNVTVLAKQKTTSAGIWKTLGGVGWRVMLGGLLLAGLVGFQSVARRARDRWRRRPGGPDHSDLPGSVRVVPVLPAGPMDVRVSDPDVAPRRLIRLTVHRHPPDVRIREVM